MLLNEIDRIAHGAGYRTVLAEAHEKKALAPLLVPHLRRLLYDLDRLAGAGARAKRGLAVLKSFIGPIKVSVGDVEGVPMSSCARARRDRLHPTLMAVSSCGGFLPPSFPRR